MDSTETAVVEEAVVAMIVVMKAIVGAALALVTEEASEIEIEVSIAVKEDTIVTVLADMEDVTVLL